MAYEYKEFPKAVYGPGGKSMTIDREDARPDGWADHPDLLVDAAKTAAAKADDTARDDEQKLRKGYRDFLDLHQVKYAGNLATPKLADLVAQLEAHLAKQVPDGNGK